MNLLIARLIGRRQELAVRTALGATRGQVVRQIVSESVLLGLAGGLLGCAVAAAGLRGVHAVAAEPFFQQLAFDVRVMSFALVLSFLAPLAFSILPTLRVLREDVRATLIEGSTRSVGSARAARGRSSLVVLQVTLAVTLLIVAALVVQSMQAVVAVDPGYDQSKLLMAQIDVAAWKVPDDQAALRLRQRVVDRVRQIPGVQGAALASHIPALQLIPQASFDIVGRPAPEERLRPSAGISTVSTDYFGVFDIPILAGRGFQSADASQPGAVAVISAETARRFWPAPAEAIGSTLRVGDATNAPIEATIVGVARNLANAIVSEGPAADIYLLDEHHPSRTSHIVLRADAPGALATSLRIAISEVDPDLPVYQMRTVSAAMADENSSNQLLSGLFAAFAMIAILLAMAGLYGVMSYAVSQRSGEIAVRMALGAPATSIARQVIGQSVKLAAIGVVLGVLGAYAMASMVASLLFGVTASDPVTYLGVVVLTLIAAVIATWLPMRRAATIDPLESLRHT
jgi:predicted permease